MTARAPAPRPWRWLAWAVLFCGAVSPALVAAQGGLVERPLSPSPGPSLLKNGGFEEPPPDGEGIQSWKLRPAADTWALDGAARTGRASLRLSGADREGAVPSSAQALALEPGLYSLEGWVKTAAIGAAKERSGVRLCLDGRPALDWWMCTPLARGTTDWRLLRQPSIPVRRPGTYRVTIDPYARPDGTAWIDDVSLTRLEPPLLDAYLLYPNFRGILFDDRSQTIRMALRVTTPTDARLAGGTIRLSLVDEAGGAVVRQREWPVSAGSFVGELDSSGLGGAGGLVRAELADRTGATLARYPDYRVVKLPKGSRERMNVWIDERNVAHLRSKPAFVLGLYTTSGYSNSRETYARGVGGWGNDRIGQAPINMIINYWLGITPISALMTYMDDLHARGIHYLHTVNFYYADHPQYPTIPYPAAREGEGALNRWIARTLTRHPGFAGFYTADERAADMIPTVFRQYRELSGSAVGSVAYAVLGDGWQEQAPLWRDALDVMGLDPYPIKRRTDNNLAMVGEWTRIGQDAVMGSRPLWMVIQYFPLTAAGGWPSRDDLRTMSWMAIIEGARGLLYWSFGEKGLAWVKEPRLREQRWQELVSVTREIKSLESVLLAPDASVVVGESSQGVIRTLGKQAADGTRYLFAYNTKAAGTDVSWTLASPASETFDLGTGRPGPTVAGGTLAARFGPYEVKRYRIR